jgi:hypothetical protein
MVAALHLDSGLDLQDAPDEIRDPAPVGYESYFAARVPLYDTLND